MILAGVQFDIAWEDKSANQSKIDAMLAAASLPRGSFVVLPELADTGFSFDLDRIADGTTLPWARELAARFGVWLQVGFATVGPDGLGRNCASIVAPDGRVRATYEKIHPFSFGGESDHYGKGDRLVTCAVNDTTTVCPLVCYDLRFPEIFRLAVPRTEVFTLGANWPNPRQAHWRALLIARAIENLAVVVGVNRTGHDPHLAYSGGSIIVGPSGEVLAEAGDEETIISVFGEEMCNIQ